MVDNTYVWSVICMVLNLYSAKLWKEDHSYFIGQSRWWKSQVCSTELKVKALDLVDNATHMQLYIHSLSNLLLGWDTIGASDIALDPESIKWVLQVAVIYMCM